MSNLACGARPFMSVAFATSCLVLTFGGLEASQGKSPAQLTPASPIGRVPVGSSPSRRDRIEADDECPRPYQLYRSHCIDCHDTDGRGEPSRETMRAIPDFTKPEWHRARSNDRLVLSIREGKGSMPAMKGKLGDTEVVQLVSLIRNFGGGRQFVPDEQEHANLHAKPTDPKRMKPLPTTAGEPRHSVAAEALAPMNHAVDAGMGVYRRLCVACHGRDGQGSGLRAQVPGLPDFTSPAWQQRRSNPQLTITIFEGKGTAMPAFRHKLDDAQVRNLVSYLRSFAPNPAPAAIEPPTGFKEQFQQLKRQMDLLEQQYRELSSQ